jgi:2-polyprenyl-3-methyl-5-hydroxy-6-metoxy-1,4-benzoquinol methylase/cell division protein FtsB
VDIVERLSPEDAAAATLVAAEHVQRYAWAAAMVDGLRVLDLCCGVGYGSAILAGTARHVHGVDYDESAVRTAQERFGAPDVSFGQADAVEVVHGDLSAYDAIVCFEGLEHLPQLDRVLERLGAFAQEGGRLLVSLPNSATFGEENEFHLTDFDFDSAMAAFDRLPDGWRLSQYVAEGTLLHDGDAAPEAPAEARVALHGDVEAEYANNYLLAVNVPEEARSAALAHMRFTVAPYYSRELRSLQRVNAEMWHANRRLGRQLDEVRRALEAGEPPTAAARSGKASAAMAVGRLTREVARLQAEAEELRAANARLAAEVAEMGHERGVALQRLETLRRRKVVRLALAAAGLLRR